MSKQQQPKEREGKNCKKYKTHYLKKNKSDLQKKKKNTEEKRKAGKREKILKHKCDKLFSSIFVFVSMWIRSKNQINTIFFICVPLIRRAESQNSYLIC